jgi:lipopolysaccharide biosynthesis glycosyltransferase
MSNAGNDAHAPARRASVLMCGDAPFFCHIATCIVSLLESNPHIHFDIVIAATEPDPEAFAKMRRTVAAYRNVALRFGEIGRAKLAGLPLTGRYRPEIYTRFWVDEFFDPSVERVLYLDGDMIVVGDIEPLLTMPMHDHPLAAVSIPGSTRPPVLGYDPGDEYFNSGVLVINMTRWREIDAKNTLIRATHEIAKVLIDPDQDVLNYCYHAQRLKLDYVWNVITPFFRWNSDLPLSAEERLAATRAARIVHFNGLSKPWQYMSTHPYKPAYLRFRAKTEWRDFAFADRTPVNVVKKAVAGLLGERLAFAVSSALRRHRP